MRHIEAYLITKQQRAVQCSIYTKLAYTDHENLFLSALITKNK
jgi:hypothetical protein